MSFKLERPVAESMTSALYRQLKHMLIIGALKPGDLLTLKSLSESTGLSQTPVREALLRLVSERLLELIHGRSVTVPILTNEKFIELRDIRINLESFAIQRAAPNVTDKDVTTIRKIQRHYMHHHEHADYAGVLTANTDFHVAIYKAANMPNLLAMIENLWARIGPYGGFMYKTPVTEHADGHPHDRIIAALANRNVSAAIAAVEEDIQRHASRMIQYLQNERLFGEASVQKIRKRGSSTPQQTVEITAAKLKPRKPKAA